MDEGTTETELIDLLRSGSGTSPRLDVGIGDDAAVTVPGGATIREGHLVMEMICDSGLLTSLDLVELNPFLDERGRTALLMVDLAASAMGRRVFDRPTRAYA